MTKLSQEGLPIEEVDIDKVPRTTVTTYPDAENKDLEKLELLIPRLSQGIRIAPQLGPIEFSEVRQEFESRLKPLPLGKPVDSEINYEGRHLITNEVVESMKVKLPLLKDGMGAISYFREELERATRLRGQHSVLAPLIQQFIEETLFGEKI